MLKTVTRYLVITTMLLMMAVFSLAACLNVVYGHKIAVCITGMASRFQPKLISPLFEGSPDDSFDLFYRLEPGNNLVYSSGVQFRYGLSDMATKNESVIESELNMLFEDIHNVKVRTVRFTQPKSRAQWLAKLGTLGKITQFEYKQEIILNMYEKTADCAHDILEYERTHNVQYDHVISTREDIYLFKNLDVSKLIAKYKNCDWIGKNCLNWGGLSMRLSVMPARLGLKYLSSKIDFYHHLKRSRRTAFNPEAYDLAHTRHVQMRVCQVPVNDVPATAARYVTEGEFCFIDAEYSNCIPNVYEAFVKSKECKL